MRFIIIQRLFAHAMLIITAVIFEFYMRKKLCRRNISWARAGPSRAELKLNWVGRAQGILGPLFCGPFRALLSYVMKCEAFLTLEWSDFDPEKQLNAACYPSIHRHAWRHKI
jgi:hypothetical protein